MFIFLKYLTAQKCNLFQLQFEKSKTFILLTEKIFECRWSTFRLCDTSEYYVGLLYYIFVNV